MSNMSRRTTLAMLGLAPATAIGAESFVDGKIDDLVVPSASYNAKIYATAFWNLADQIEQGRVDIFKMRFESSIDPSEFLKNLLSVEFSYRPDAA